MGKQGELLARKYLKKNKFKIEEVNYVAPMGEADIIAWEQNTLVFIEVKTRSGDGFGSGAEAVNEQKRRRYVKIAQYYLLTHRLSDVNVRFDVIEVKNGDINHIVSAFGI